MTPRPSIIVVDDDRAAASSVVALLCSIGLQATTFDSAEAFLAALPSTIDCLILDVQLPGKSGPELLDELCKQGKCPPTILVCGNAGPRLHEKASECGAMTILEKPVPGPKLCQAVRDALSLA